RMFEMIERAGEHYDARRATLAASYGQILIYGSVITMATRAVSQFFYGMHKPGIVLIASVTGNLVNFGLNYMLVFGHFGMPRLELQGSAIATVIGTAVELSIPLTSFLIPMNRLYGTRASWRPSWARIKEIVKIGW